jgi:hypothetical protein
MKLHVLEKNDISILKMYFVDFKKWKEKSDTLDTIVFSIIHVHVYSMVF